MMSGFSTEIAANIVDQHSEAAEPHETRIERPVSFRNSNDLNLFGMQYIPLKVLPLKRIGVLICVNAVKYRIGAFRYHTILARHLSENGYHVMNFDPAGIGDSEGVFEEKYLFEHYCDIQKGKYSCDIIDAATYFKAECKLDNVVLLGLCGGAVSSLIAASKFSQIEGLVLLGTPVLLEFSGDKKEKFDKSSTITSSKYALSVLLPMLKKLFNRETWGKIIRGKVQWMHELKVFFTSIKVLVVENLKQLLSIGRKRGVRSDRMSDHPRYNRIFHQSIMEYFSNKRKALFVFGELDFMTWVFKSEFQDKILVPGNPYEELYELHVIDKANHIFTTKESQVQLNRIIDEWLNEHFNLS